MAKSIRAAAARIAAMASGLLSSMPTRISVLPSRWRMIATPCRISSARVRISTSSQVIHGSHSPPLMMRMGQCCVAPGSSLTALGNTAPPRPASPRSRSRMRRSVGAIAR